jgi:hypothetical protein
VIQILFLETMSPSYLNTADGYPDKALMTVQFDWQPEEGAVKMDGRLAEPVQQKVVVIPDDDQYESPLKF